MSNYLTVADLIAVLEKLPLGERITDVEIHFADGWRHTWWLPDEQAVLPTNEQDRNKAAEQSFARYRELAKDMTHDH